MAASEHIRKKLGTVPHKPGVYLHKDRFGTVIYVGKALDLRKRVSQYFQSSHGAEMQLHTKNYFGCIEVPKHRKKNSDSLALFATSKTTNSYLIL